jgi:hypothetical protein
MYVLAIGKLYSYYIVEGCKSKVDLMKKVTFAKENRVLHLSELLKKKGD